MHHHNDGHGIQLNMVEDPRILYPDCVCHDKSVVEACIDIVVRGPVLPICSPSNTHLPLRLSLSLVSLILPVLSYLMSPSFGHAWVSQRFQDNMCCHVHLSPPLFSLDVFFPFRDRSSPYSYLCFSARLSTFSLLLWGLLAPASQPSYSFTLSSGLLCLM